ncbi:MAG: hypothetical protein ACTSWW_10585 [Promethearchaeota archaeon]
MNVSDDSSLQKTVNKIGYITLFGIIQFLVLSILAMIVFPGGTREDASIQGYSLTYNKFSDLGMWESYAGGSNLASFLLFNISLIIVGLSLLPYVIFSAKYFISQELPKYWVMVGEIAGIISCLGFILIGLTPRDLQLDLHHLGEYAAFLAIFIMSLTYMLFIFKDKDYPNKYTIVYAVCVICQLLYLFVVFNVYVPSLAFDCITQKLIVYIQLVVFLIQSIGILHLDKD